MHLIMLHTSERFERLHKRKVNHPLGEALGSRRKRGNCVGRMCRDASADFDRPRTL